MPGYADFHSDAEKIYHARQYRRRRAIAGIRGALRAHHSPQWITLGCFIGSLLPGSAIGYLAYRLGFDPWGGALAVTIVSTWPIFIFASWRAANRLFETDKLLNDFKDSVLIDDIREGWETAGILGHRLPTKFEESVRHGWNSGLNALSHSGNALIMAIPLMIALTLVTFGSWIVWQLITYGPTLLAEMIVDGCLIRKFPKIEQLFPLDDWKTNAFLATSIHFVALTITIWILGSLLEIIVRI